MVGDCYSHLGFTFHLLGCHFSQTINQNLEKLTTVLKESTKTQWKAVLVGERNWELLVSVLGYCPSGQARQEFPHKGQWLSE